MELLNSEEMKGLTGGLVQAVCTKTGDTVLKTPNNIVVLCATYELKCPSGFSNACGNGDIGNCPANTPERPGVTITPKGISSELDSMTEMVGANLSANIASASMLSANVAPANVLSLLS